MNLREAWEVMNDVFDAENDEDETGRISQFTLPQLEALALLLRTADMLVNYFDSAELADNPDATSGADDAAALYEILCAGGLEVC